MASIEERRIYKSGKSSMALTLPRGWLRFWRRDAGDHVEIEINNVIIIRPLKKAKKGVSKSR